MRKRSVLGALRGAFDRCRPVLQGLGRCSRCALELYRDALRQNLLLRPLRGRKASRPVSPSPPPQPESSGNVVPFPQRSIPPPTPSRAPEPTSSPETSGARAALGEVGLALAAGAPVVLLISLLVQAFSASTADRVLTTGANETAAAELPGGSTVALGARSTVKVDGTEQQSVANLVEGEAIFEVPRDAANPLVVHTPLATARAQAGSKFRVSMDSSVEFELFAGVVHVFPRGANGEPAAIVLKKGRPHRVPVDMRGAIVASHRGSGVAKPAGG